jgi:hypothetical protein
MIKLVTTGTTETTLLSSDIVEMERTLEQRKADMNAEIAYMEAYTRTWKTSLVEDGKKVTYECQMNVGASQNAQRTILVNGKSYEATVVIARANEDEITDLDLSVLEAKTALDTLVKRGAPSVSKKRVD